MTPALPSGTAPTSGGTEGAVLRGKRPSPQIQQLKRTLYLLRRNRLAIVGLGILLFFIGIALYSFFFSTPLDSSGGLSQLCGTFGGPTQGCICTYPIGSPAPANSTCYPVPLNDKSLIAPTFTFVPYHPGPLPMGSLTVSAGGPYFFNLYAGLIKGAPWSLGIAASVVISGSLIGLLLGSIAGYSGGYVDEGIMRFTDIFLSIPGLLLLIVILSTAGTVIPGLYGHLWLLIIAFIITDWPIYTRIVRGQVLVTREQKYVEAAKASGARSTRILRKHIVPNSLYPVFVQMSLDVGTIPLSLAVLVFLGFSIFPSTYFPEWGSITALSVNETFMKSILTYCLSDTSCVFPWWQIFLPGLTLFFFAISVNFLSDGLRDALDPRLRR
ncbi:MAG TPA: ABC transporter permease [Thermoplasmata archaeon]|nr:ABC transporter permease [Thermoplasmata archaeon]